MSWTETALTLVALVAAAITPNVFVTGGLHLAPTPAVARYVLLPAILVQFAVLVYARRIGCHRLVNRLVVDAWVGLVATTGLDVVRQPGTFLGYLLHDEARMAGEMILGGGHHGAASAHGVGPAPAGTAHGQGEARAARPSGRDQPPARGHDSRETGKLLGAHILADEAGEVIQAATLAVKFGLRVQDLIDTFHPYLTMAEGLKLAALSFDKDVARLSCCAA